MSENMARYRLTSADEISQVIYKLGSTVLFICLVSISYPHLHLEYLNQTMAPVWGLISSHDTVDDIWCYNLNWPHGGTRVCSYMELNHSSKLSKTECSVMILSVNLIVVLDRDVNYRAVTFHRALVMWVSTPWGICTGLGPSVWESLRLMEPSTTQMASTPNSWRTTNWYQHTCLPLYSVSSPLSYLSSKFLSFLPSQNTSALLF